jgi:hypothetical protein
MIGSAAFVRYSPPILNPSFNTQIKILLPFLFPGLIFPVKGPLLDNIQEPRQEKSDK